MSDFDSGNSVNCILLDVNLYENKEGKIIYPLYLKVTAKDTNDISNTFRYGLEDKAQFLRHFTLHLFTSVRLVNISPAATVINYPSGTQSNQATLQTKCIRYI